MHTTSPHTLEKKTPRHPARPTGARLPACTCSQGGEAANQGQAVGVVAGVKTKTNAPTTGQWSCNTTTSNERGTHARRNSTLPRSGLDRRADSQNGRHHHAARLSDAPHAAARRMSDGSNLCVVTRASSIPDRTAAASTADPSNLCATRWRWSSALSISAAISSPLHGIGRGAGCGWLGCTADISPINVGSQHLAAHASGRDPLNQGALISRNLALTVTPKTHRLRRHTQRKGKFGDAASGGNGRLNWIHAAYSTHVEIKNLHLCLSIFLRVFTLAKSWQ